MLVWQVAQLSISLQVAWSSYDGNVVSMRSMCVALDATATMSVCSVLTGIL